MLVWTGKTISSLVRVWDKKYFFRENYKTLITVEKENYIRENYKTSPMVVLEKETIGIANLLVYFERIILMTWQLKVN